jgi:hypothetical protein
MSSKLSKETQQHCTHLLDMLCQDANAEVFLEPVDWKAMDLPDYPDIVKNPMDLSTVRKNLNAGVFGSVDEFVAQIQLIWDNCKLYNMQGSHIYKICERMEKVYNRELGKFQAKIGHANSHPSKRTTTQRKEEKNEDEVTA